MAAESGEAILIAIVKITMRAEGAGRKLTGAITRLL
jgi:hypothetical protein